MNLKFTGTRIFALSLALTAVASLKVMGQQTMVLDEIIAKVDNYIILRSDMEKSYLEMLSRNDITGITRCDALETLVINKMLVAKAEIDSVMVEDGDVENNLDRRLQFFINQVGSEERLEEFYGKTIDQFKDELRESVKEQMVVEKMQGTITKDLTVTPAEVKKFFKTIPTDSLPFFSTEVTIGQIVKIPEPGEVEKEKIRTQLTAIRNKILAGESMATLAQQYSMDPSVRRNNGELGFFRRGDLAPEFEATALSMQPGEISMPVETDFGFHIIQLVERRGNTYNSRHILMIPVPSPADIKASRDYLDSLKTQIEAKTITFEKAAKEYSDDKATASDGGFLLDGTGAPRVSVEEIDPVLFFTLDTMKVGNITAPIDYRLDDGTQALRLIYYKDKVSPHQANLEQDFQKIYQATLSAKKNKILSEWFRKAQGDVYIDVDPEFDFCNLLKENY
ncbi:MULTISPECIES: peptidylprolyl isomerase [unclassified Imperialibacter]|uniref:peptidylprolyl isomerase n=1 Tax=unclassified Imperialibacter TaxID=2629706 RepID=UPI001257B49F|nr:MULTISPECIES: peptidylprolyl isomerase [unclassified Imperialibacter]CAD5289567.1 Peptidylprolyl isomerase [Imperialibacter sp. 89]CAD5289835.1 Peptidylprolyl isomerase [Imperialibacter sp. 75]VVT34562.1 Peptidylprolyl isomerase [Imperialibacter sp. EC-SDR9]